MPATHRVELSEVDRKELQTLLNRRTTPKRLHQRASIILQASQHKPNKEIALELSINIETVARWRNRYITSGIAGIKTELPRGANHGGKNSAAQAELRSLIVEATTQKKPENATHWSTRTLARHLNVAPSLVTRVWRDAGLKPNLN
jgi:transposase